MAEQRLLGESDLKELVEEFRALNVPVIPHDNRLWQSLSDRKDPALKVYVSWDIEKKGPRLDSWLVAVGCSLVVEKAGNPLARTRTRIAIERGDQDVPDDGKCIEEFWDKLPDGVRVLLQHQAIRPPEACRRLEAWMQNVEACDFQSLDIVVDYATYDMVHLAHFLAKYTPRDLADERNGLNWFNNKIRWEVSCDAFVESLGPDRKLVGEFLNAALGPKTHLPDEDAERNYWELWAARKLHERIRYLAHKRKRDEEEDDQGPAHKRIHPDDCL